MEDLLSSSSKPVVILAEDDEDYLFIITYACKQAGFNEIVKPVRSFNDLMNYLQSGEHPQLIILDLNTTQTEWREALLVLKGDKRYEKIPVAALSAYIDQKDIDLCEEHYRCSCIQKPESFADWKVCMEGIIWTNLIEFLSYRKVNQFPPPPQNTRTKLETLTAHKPGQTMAARLFYCSYDYTHLSEKRGEVF